VRQSVNHLTLALVAFVLGLLLVGQLRSQDQQAGLGTLSATDLTVLVANLNTRNDQLRGEITSLEVELAKLASGQTTGRSSADQVRSDLARVRAWTGLDAVSGSGIRVTISGPISGDAVQDLLNELHNAGADALAVEGVRVVVGSVVSGAPGGMSIEGSVLPDPFEVSAIGNPATLTGSLTRAGGIVAQLAATFPAAQLTVVPVDLLRLPATKRSLVPRDATPQL
jgi:uncharacterized protein YlxW (UPF0749 family)